MEIKWYGTATISIKAADETILFDPFLSLNHTCRYLGLNEVANIENIFITHGHFDHLMDVPTLLEAGRGKVYCNETAATTLRNKGIATERIVCIKPGDLIKLRNFEIEVLKGDHIVFDFPLIVRTLFCRRMFQWLKNIGKIINGFIKYPKGQVLIYNIKANGQQILHMGSLGMCFDEQYPYGIDLLTLPFQGRSELDDIAMQFISRINPQAVFLQHFDDSFPPISNHIETVGFIYKMTQLFPKIKVIKPDYLKSYSILSKQSLP